MKSGIPPEWAPHRATWMAWPRSAIWGRRTNAVRAEIDRVARTICAYEPVRLLYDPDDCGALPQVAEIEPVARHYDDIRLRDTGPILTHDEAIVCRFIGWGGRVRAWRRDVAVGKQLHGKSGAEGKRVEVQ